MTMAWFVGDVGLETTFSSFYDCFVNVSTITQN